MICALFSRSTCCSRMGTLICNMKVKHACDLVSLFLMNIIIDLFYDYVESVQVYFRKKSIEPINCIEF